MKRKILALLLTLAICVTFMPTLAFMTAPEVSAATYYYTYQYDANQHGVFHVENEGSGENRWGCVNGNMLLRNEKYKSLNYFLATDVKVYPYNATDITDDYYLIAEKDWEFDGWYVNDKKYDFGKGILSQETGDESPIYSTTLVAHWHYTGHTHTWTYTADQASKTIIAKCSDPKCGTEYSVTLTADDKAYDGKEYVAKVNTDNWPNGKGLATPTVEYCEGTEATAMADKPKKVGTYNAKMVVKYGTDSSAFVQDPFEITSNQETCNHDWKYSGSGNTVYAKCDDCGKTQSASVTAKDMPYSGYYYKAVLDDKNWTAKNLATIKVTYHKYTTALSSGHTGTGNFGEAVDAKDVGTYLVMIELVNGTGIGVAFDGKELSASFVYDDFEITPNQDMCNHNWKYSVGDGFGQDRNSIITATCETCEKIQQLQLTKITGKTYDGKPQSIKVIDTDWTDKSAGKPKICIYKETNGNNTLELTGLDKDAEVDEAIEVGHYYAKVTLVDSGTSTIIKPDVVYLQDSFDITPAKLVDYVAPTAIEPLVWNGYAQKLVNPGTVKDNSFKMQYRIIGGPELDVDYEESEWSNDVPSAVMAGSYTVQYRIVSKSGDDVAYLDNFNSVTDEVTAVIKSTKVAHDWMFEGRNNQIIARCDTNGCEVSPATLTLRADDKDYDGSFYKAVIELNNNWKDSKSGLTDIVNENSHVDYYQCINNDDNNLKKMNSAPKEAGRYLAVIGIDTEDKLLSAADYNVDAHDVVYAIKYFTINEVEFDGYKVPSAKELTYNAKKQSLINAGTVEDGTMEYSLDGKTWSTDVATITGKDAKDYTVKWRVVGSDHVTASGEVVATINPFEVGVKWGSTSLVYDGSYKAPKATATNLFAGDTCTIAVTGEQCSVTPEGEVYLAKANGTDNANYVVPNNAEIEYLIVEAKEPYLLAKVACKTATSNKLTWQKVAGAETYSVYAAKCGKSFKRIKSGITGTTYTQKGLKKHTYYKYYVKAYDEDGELLAKSNNLHIVTTKYSGKYANPTVIVAAKTKVVNAKVGGTVNLSGKKGASMKVYKGKKLTTKWHANELRYLSTDTTVAKVGSNGIVHILRSGTVRIYIQAPNGIWAYTDIQVAR